METEMLKKVQEKQMEIMDQIHELCVKNSLRYYIIGGTAIGAVRHGGYIPWDVDIDIAMPRPDYDKFVQETYKQLDSKFTCYSWEKEDIYYPPHALVSMNGTKLVTKNEHLNPKLKNHGIFVDILPLDQAPDEKDKQIEQAQALLKITTLKNRKLALSFSANSAIKVMMKKVISLFYCFISVKEINRRQEQEMKRYSEEKDCKYWCSMASHYKYEKQCMPKEVYGTPTLVDFEGRQYYGPEKMDEYLTRIFGDYMKLPPKEEQDWQRGYFVHAEWNEND